MFSRVDLLKLGTGFDVPMFLVHGEADLVATPDVARVFFNRLTAPQKAYVLVPRSGHDSNEALVDAQFKLLTEHVQTSVK